ncbi:hypothetical protein KJ909_03230 [Patescibacteria group bacterium]|nr:hypothetical protein [Patescibacteria group bacterium]
MIKRLEQNPILIPDKQNKWETKGCFNPSVVKVGNGYKMAYRAVSDEGKSIVAVAESDDGLDWKNKKELVTPSEEWDKYGCEDPRVTFLEGKYYIFYTAISNWPPTGVGIKVGVAISKDLVTIEEKHLVTPFNAKATGLFPDKVNGKYTLVVTADTETLPPKIGMARAEKLEDFWNEDFWNRWHGNIRKHRLRLGRLNTDHVEIGALPIKTETGWLFFYSHISNYFIENKRIFGIEAVVTDLNQATKILKRTDGPLLKPETEYERSGEVKNVIFPSSAIDMGDKWRIYYGAADTFGAVGEIGKKELREIMDKNKIKRVVKLKKYKKNPILTAIDKHAWEAKAVFNPSVVREGDKFLVIYRALSKEMVSTMGCAISKDGYNFFWRLPDPIYVPRMNYEQKRVEGNYSGCEDPRITKIGDKFYMFYTAYNGAEPPRVAMSWIAEKDLIAQNWLWSEPVLISPPSEDNKDACLFPEKILGRYLLLHRVGGKDIALDWLDDLDHFDGVNWLEKEEAIERVAGGWEGAKIGIAGPPIKTDDGWLLLYHGVSEIDGQYRVGAMMLDLLEPAKILARAKYPILEPTEEFEKVGLVNNVVFPCGAVVVKDRLFVYYGGADQAIGVASIKLQKLLDYLKAQA